MSDVVAVVALAAALAAAVVRDRRAPEAVVALAGAGLVLAVGALTPAAAWDEAKALGPTLGLLAALLVLGDGCERAGLFDALAGVMARAARGDGRRLLAVAVAVAAAVTAVLGLDATVVLLTPAALVAAARAGLAAAPAVYACTHLANAGSLLLPVSNLTNLLAFRAAHVSFLRFAELMALPWLMAVTAEGAALGRFFRADVRAPARPVGEPRPDARLPRGPLAVLAATLAGFASSGPLGVDPAWFAAAGAAALVLPQMARGRGGNGDLTGTAPRSSPRAMSPAELVRAVDLPLLGFVLGLGIVVRAVTGAGLGDAVAHVLPGGDGLLALLGAAAVAAVLANLLNNLPALLVLLPAAAAAGPATVLAVLVGVDVGPNLTYTGSLATLLWRRVLHERGSLPDLGSFLRLGLLTVPAILAGATVALWLAWHVL